MLHKKRCLDFKNILLIFKLLSQNDLRHELVLSMLNHDKACQKTNKNILYIFKTFFSWFNVRDDM